MTAMMSTALAATHRLAFCMLLAPDVQTAPRWLLCRRGIIVASHRDPCQRDIAAVERFQVLCAHTLQPETKLLGSLAEAVVQLLPSLAQAHQDAAAVIRICAPLGEPRLNKAVHPLARGGHAEFQRVGGPADSHRAVIRQRAQSFHL